MMNQREAVYTATHSVLSDAGIDFEDFGDISDVMTQDLRGKIHTIVCELFSQGKVNFKDTVSNTEKMENETKLKSYVSGLISNWFRKDKRFNGNVVYQPKNPGSRTGQGDQVLKTLRALHKQYVDIDNTKADLIKEQITVRLETIASERAKKTPIDLSVLSPELLEELDLNESEEA
jgi:hypothetical protein